MKYNDKRSSRPIYSVPFRSKGRTFVELDEHILKKGNIIIGEPLLLAVDNIGEIILTRENESGAARRRSASTMHEEHRSPSRRAVSNDR